VSEGAFAGSPASGFVFRRGSGRTRAPGPAGCAHRGPRTPPRSWLAALNPRRSTCAACPTAPSAVPVANVAQTPRASNSVDPSYPRPHALAGPERAISLEIVRFQWISMGQWRISLAQTHENSRNLRPMYLAFSSEKESDLRVFRVSSAGLQHCLPCRRSRVRVPSAAFQLSPCTSQLPSEKGGPKPPFVVAQRRYKRLSGAPLWPGRASHRARPAPRRSELPRRRAARRNGARSSARWCP
jgi:hypothetical protein